jgi:phage tail sheath protein FI
MPTTYRTPGVYIEEIPKFPPSIAAVETAIPAFIGYTQKAKVGAENFHASPKVIRPIRITSLLEYETFFGKAIPETNLEVLIQDTTDGSSKVIDRKANARFNSSSPGPGVHNLYYAMQAFFANSGGPCYIVSVGPMTGSIDVNDLLAGLTEVAKEDEVTLLAFPESQALSDVDYAGLMAAALDQCGNLQDRFAVMDLPVSDPLTPPETILTAARAFRDLTLPLDNLKYGACYTPNIETIFNYFYKTDDETAEVGEGRVAILRSVNGQAAVADGTMYTYNPAHGGDGTQYALIKAALDQLPLTLPPTPLVLGQYAKTDNTRGVWKAPANVALASVIKPKLKITNEQQNDLNVHTTGKSINAIRAFTGKGILIWGARTLAGNDNEWRYIPVRRFFNMAEESIKKGTEPFVFEPNDANTWVKVRSMIENFLILQWRSGALQGAKPEHAFYVKVGLNETMTALDILEGRMIIEIGMAVVRPAEFIILKFSHKMAES